MRTVLALAVFFFGQFALASNSDLVNVSISPQSPIVITGDVHVGDRTVTAPWFRFQPIVSNNSSENLTIVAMSLKVYATDGTRVYTNASVTPSDFNYETSQGECLYYRFDVVPAGAKNQSLAVTPEGPNTQCSRTPAIAYIGGNPIMDNKSNYRYQVEVTLQGWFGDQGDAGERLQKTFTFYTQ